MILLLVFSIKFNQSTPTDKRQKHFRKKIQRLMNEWGVKPCGGGENTWIPSV